MTDTATESWDDRRLCPEGTCTGLLDASGVCSVCGQRGGEAMAPSARAASDGSDEPAAVEPAAAARGPAGRGGAGGNEGEDQDLDDRELCPDGTCIGVIGADGRCRTCGTAAHR